MRGVLICVISRIPGEYGQRAVPTVPFPFFWGFLGFPVDPVNYRILEPSPYVNPYQGCAFSTPDFEMARTNLSKNLDDEVVEVLCHRTMTMASENAEKSGNYGSVIKKSIRKVNRLENYFGKK